ncbi:hypothetical protein OA848_05935 [Rickettsiales bacterium]|nr:hypothetical protein [Rickettsiales bacterium]
MYQKKCLNKEIYGMPTFNFSNLEQGEYISKITNKSKIKINLIYSYNLVNWQGPMYVRDLLKKLINKNIFYYVDCGNNYRSVLEIIRTDIENIIFSCNDKTINKKIKSLSGRYNLKIFSMNKFKKYYPINETNNISFFKTEFNSYLRKIKSFK